MGKRQVYIQAVDVLGGIFGINIELAIKHKKAGDDVHLIVCRGDMLACPPNSRHDKLACRLCISKQDRALKLPALEGVVVHEMQLRRDHKEFSAPRFKSAYELKSYCVDGVNHGLEAASSVFTVLKDPRPDLEKEQDLVQANLVTAVAVYRWAMEFFKDRVVDQLYVLNGRYSSQMPMVRVANHYGIPLTTFEVAHDSFKYVLVEGTYYHDLDEKKREVEALWEEAGPSSDREAIGHRFFKDRRFGTDSQFPETKYKSHQRRGRLPDKFDPEKRNVIVYNSSEDEFAAVTGYENPVYADQMVGLRRILDDDRLSKDLQIWLRVHPHLAGRNNSQIDDIANLKHPQLHVIDSTEVVDSYALMEKAEKVITFGSAMSVESAYAAIPSILIGREAYEHLGCCYTPKTHDEVMDLINNPDLLPLPQEGALKYGYWCIAREYDYQYYNPRVRSVGDVSVRPALYLLWTAKFWWSRYGHKVRRIFGWM